MNALDRIETVKRRAIVAVFSDDTLMRQLVLKGGNALQIAYGITTRGSFDLDFSMTGEFESVESLEAIVQRVIPESFHEIGWWAFDLQVVRRPPELSEDLKSFWGGYSIEFKVIELDRTRNKQSDIQWLRRHAFSLGPTKSTVFNIDISCHEYCSDTISFQIDDYTIRAYSLDLMICEKLRAICQQHPEYGPIVKRNRPGSPRPRDFVDIHSIRLRHSVDVTSARFQLLLATVFAAKRVPMSLLNRIGETRDFHFQGFEAVRATVSADVELREFDFYVGEVLALCEQLESFRDE